MGSFELRSHWVTFSYILSGVLKRESCAHGRVTSLFSRYRSMPLRPFIPIWCVVILHNLTANGIVTLGIHAPNRWALLVNTAYIFYLLSSFTHRVFNRSRSYYWLYDPDALFISQVKQTIYRSFGRFISASFSSHTTGHIFKPTS
jgi:hypothetical protein